MRLDELEWDTRGYARNATLLLLGEKWRVRYEPSNNTYCIGVWFCGWQYENLDPIAAQAVLYHLTAEVIT